MPLKLLYITNRPAIAEIAQTAGVDRIFVDMEYIGKDERQAGLNTVKSHHTSRDIQNIAAMTARGGAELLVRVNPIHEATRDYCSSREEIDTAIDCGADMIMLPMFRTCREVDTFLSCVNGRAKTVLLAETREALEHLDDILSVGGYDEVHLGLNDLHLAYRRRFMFELLADGTVDAPAATLRARGVPFGIGGIARIGCGTLPAEYIITEHYRLGSGAAILSRSFCDADRVSDPESVRDVFLEGVRNIRAFEARAAQLTEAAYAENHRTVGVLVDRILQGAS